MPREHALLKRQGLLCNTFLTQLCEICSQNLQILHLSGHHHTLANLYGMISRMSLLIKNLLLLPLK